MLNPEKYIDYEPSELLPSKIVDKLCDMVSRKDGILFLYVFYLVVANEQKSAHISVSEEYCKERLHWGTEKLRKAKRLLIKEGLIENHFNRDKYGKISNHYIIVKQPTYHTHFSDIEIYPEPLKKHSLKRNGFVYFIKSGDSIKIGSTTKPVEKRKASIDTGNPNPTEIIHVIQTDNINNTESKFHTLFGNKRIKGEWFALDSQDQENIRKYGSLLIENVPNN